MERDFVIRKLDKKCYERQDGIHPARSPLHCFFYLKEGTVLVDIAEKTYFIQADDLVIIPSGQIFKVRYYEGSQGYMGGFHSQCVMGLNEQDGAMNRFPFLRVWGEPKIILGADASARINMLFERLEEENGKENPNRDIISAYLTTLLVEVDVIYSRQISGTGERGGDQLSNRFLDLLFHSQDSQIKQHVTEYAAKLNISPNHLNKVVKNFTGKSPSEWIEEAIMVKAKMLLRNTSKPLSEIASELGIHDQSYFTRRFKLHQGITPTKFRSQSSTR